METEDTIARSLLLWDVVRLDLRARVAAFAPFLPADDN